MSFLFDLGLCFGYFIVMMIFMITTILAANRAIGWALYWIGAIVQLFSLFGSSMNNSIPPWYWVIYFGLLIITALIAAKRRNSKQPQEENKEEEPQKQLHSENTCNCFPHLEVHHTTFEQDTEIKAKEPTVNKLQFCRKCGNKLLDDANFCNKCGTKIIEIKEGGEDNAV